MTRFFLRAARVSFILVLVCLLSIVADFVLAFLLGQQGWPNRGDLMLLGSLGAMLMTPIGTVCWVLAKLSR